MVTRISSGSTAVRGACISSALFLITPRAGSGLMVTQGTPSFIMPAFSKAIFSMVSPRYSVCSRLMLLMTETKGVTTLVASNLPPIPTSNTAISTFSSRKCIMAMAVVTSKNVHCRPLSAMSSHSCFRRPHRRASLSSEMGSPFTAILSRKSSTSGEV